MAKIGAGFRTEATKVYSHVEDDPRRSRHRCCCLPVPRVRGAAGFADQPRPSPQARRPCLAGALPPSSSSLPSPPLPPPSLLASPLCGTLGLRHARLLPLPAPPLLISKA